MIKAPIRHGLTEHRMDGKTYYFRNWTDEFPHSVGYTVTDGKCYSVVLERLAVVNYKEAGNWSDNLEKQYEVIGKALKIAGDYMQAQFGDVE